FLNRSIRAWPRRPRRRTAGGATGDSAVDCQAREAATAVAVRAARWARVVAGARWLLSATIPPHVPTTRRKVRMPAATRSRDGPRACDQRRQGFVVTPIIQAAWESRS